MQIHIYFMTGTGNTKRAAELFKLQLDSMGHECVIKNWIHEGFSSWNEADAFGFATPVHAFREPSPFKKKLKLLPKTNIKLPCFIIASSDGMEGATFIRIAKRLRKKGVNVIATYPYYALSNVLMWEKMMRNSLEYDDPHKDDKMLYHAKSLPELIKTNKPIKLKKKIEVSLLAAIIPDRGLRYLIRGKIRVDESKCTKCGLCAKTCISQCITLDPFPIINKKKCCACLGCLNLCPNDALDAKNTVGKERYKGPGKLKHHPLI